MSGKADKGKWAEKEVQTWLNNASNASTGMAWHRFPDARAARGLLAAQPSDFMAVKDGDFYLIEVKETAQERRLPRTKVSQLGTLKKFYWAGASVVVLVYMSSIDKWVWLDALNLSFADGDDILEPPTSFLLTNLPQYATAAEALQEIFK